MQRLVSATVIAGYFTMFGATAVDAKPIVQLKLQGSIVERDAKGAETLVPLGSVRLTPGELIRYDVVATNSGSDAASKFEPTALVPAGTQYENGSASLPGAVRVEFSIDSAKTWAAKPLVRVLTPRGSFEKSAPTSMYTTVRWVGDKDLAPQQTVTYSYEVRVK